MAFANFGECLSSKPCMRRNFSTSRGTSHSQVADRRVSMSAFPGGSCSLTPAAPEQAGSKDCRFELPDLGRGGHVPFRSDLFAGLLFLGIDFPFSVIKDRSVSRVQSSHPKLVAGTEDSAGRLCIKAPWEDSCHSGMPLAHARHSALPELLLPRVLQQLCGYAWSPPSLNSPSNNCRTKSSSAPITSRRGNRTFSGTTASCRSWKILWSHSIASM